MKFSLISSLLALFLVPFAFADDELLNNDFIVDFVGDATLTIAEILESNPNFSELIFGLNQSGWFAFLTGEGPFTLFAPTDAAVKELKTFSPGILEEWQVLAPESSIGVIARPWSLILPHNMFAGEVQSTDIEDGLILEMIDRNNATLMLNPPMIEEANIILTDVKASNGVRSSGCNMQYLLCFLTDNPCLSHSFTDHPCY